MKGDTALQNGGQSIKERLEGVTGVVSTRRGRGGSGSEKRNMG